MRRGEAYKPRRTPPAGIWLLGAPQKKPQTLIYVDSSHIEAFENSWGQVFSLEMQPKLGKIALVTIH